MDTSLLAPPLASKLIYLYPGDSVELRETGHQLDHFGYVCQAATCLEDLLARCETVPPASILVDCGALCRLPAEARLQFQTLADRVPLACMSSDGRIEARLDAVRLGCKAYFSRPLDMSVVLDTLDRLTSPPQAEAGKVLIIDDSPSLAGFYAAHLNSAGFVTQVLTKPLGALEALADNLPEIILLDMHMPDANGVELARVIRQQDTFLSIPIVFLSAETDMGRQREAMSQGGDEFLQKPIQPEHLISAVRSRIIRYRALRALMVRDSLTGLLNHTSFKERLRAEVGRAKRQNKPLSVGLIDIDHFKRVNDTHGHPAGDRVIKNLSRMLRQRLRGSDVIGRYGGEEFALALPDTDLGAARALVDEIRQRFAAIEQHAGKSHFQSTFSCGLVQFPVQAEADGLIQAADEALYRAKHGGRNQVALADQSR